MACNLLARKGGDLLLDPYVFAQFPKSGPLAVSLHQVVKNVGLPHSSNAGTAFNLSRRRASAYEAAPSAERQGNQWSDFAAGVPQGTFADTHSEQFG
jgi:hypothetical protein